MSILQYDPSTDGQSDPTQASDPGDQLSRLQAEVDALRNQLRQAQRLATIGTMAAMVAHEFNNILTPVINYAQAAQKNPRLVQKAILRAADGGERATTICNAILSIARNPICRHDEVNVLETVRETLTVMARDFAKDSIELVLDIPETLTLVTRKVELQQVLLNLIANARSALLESHGQRRITLSARAEDGEVILAVADTGCGIPPENLDKIFLPFFTTRSCAEGSGLGLSVCQEIVESLGGSIRASSTPGQGAAFTLRLPSMER